jgi:hypothetical protein
MKFAFLSPGEEKTVQQFFLEKHSIPFSFWNGKKLLKRVHSVWVLSEKAAEALQWVECDSAGLLLLLELKTLKPSKQGIAFLSQLQ